MKRASDDRKMMIPAKEGRATKIEPKPGSDYPPVFADEDWERDRRVRLPNDRLVKSFAITLGQFKAAQS